MGNSTDTAAANPLLQSEGLPRFDLIRPEHVVPGITALLADLEGDFARIEQGAAPTWHAVVEPLEHLNDRLGLAWGTVGHLMGSERTFAEPFIRLFART